MIEKTPVKLSLQYPPERVVFNADFGIEHAIGARVVRGVEMGIVDDELISYKQQLLEGFNPPSLRQKLLHQTGLKKYDDDTRAYTIHEADLEYLNRARNNRVAETKAELDNVRAKLRRPVLRALEDPETTYFKLPPYLRHQFLEASKGVMGSSLVVSGETDTADWLLASGTEQDDARFINFLQHYVHRREEAQSDELLKTQLELKKADWLTSLEHGVRSGWFQLTPDQLEEYDEKIKGLRVVYADRHDLDHQGRGGYAFLGDGYVVLPLNYMDVNRVVKHEINHAVLGYFKPVWLNEAVTEHIAQVFDGHREMEDIDIGAHEHHRLQGHDRTYSYSRSLLYSLIGASKGQLKMTDFTLAYVDNLRGGEEKLEEALRQRIKTIFNEDMIQTITSYYDEAIKNQEKQGYKNIDGQSVIESASEHAYHRLMNP